MAGAPARNPGGSAPLEASEVPERVVEGLELRDGLAQRIDGEEQCQRVEQLPAGANRCLALGRRSQLLLLVVESELLGAPRGAIDVAELIGEELLVIGVV